MIFNVGDLVSRNSYNNDVIFKIIKIEDDKAYLKGVEVRLLADSPTTDLKIISDNISDDFDVDINNDFVRNNDFFYLPGKILHLDGDGEYLSRCLKFYKSKNVYAIGKKIKEENIPNQLIILLKEYRPDVLVITGHDAYYKKKGSKSNIDNYKNSKNFVEAVKIARKYERSHDKLVIIAGACQSDYEDIIKAGANYASSPKRINIHALDPAIIATYVATTKRNEEIDLIDLLNKTKYGSDGMGGIISNGLMYVGFPR
jgi:spore coat assembly protein